MNKIIVLVGESASGKTEIEKGLERIYGIKPLISHTSRPARVGEVDGTHYHFVSDDVIRKLIDNGETVEHTTYEVDGQTWFYALSRQEVNKALEHKLTVVTINPRGIEQMLDDGEFNKNIVVTYLKASEPVRASRYFAREDKCEGTLSRWEQRTIQDLEDFDRFEKAIVNKIHKNKVEYIEIENNQNYTDLEVLIEIAKDRIMNIIEGE